MAAGGRGRILPGGGKAALPAPAQRRRSPCRRSRTRPITLDAVPYRRCAASPGSIGRRPSAAGSRPGPRPPRRPGPSPEDLPISARRAVWSDCGPWSGPRHRPIRGSAPAAGVPAEGLCQSQEERVSALPPPRPNRQPPGTPRSQLGGDPLRLDAIHKATTLLASRYETVVVEDLNVAGMLRNRRLARSLSDQSFGTVRQQLGYQTAWRGGRLIVADRFLPSSKTCSACGMAKAKLSLAERVYRCEGCGLVIDRDVNAARNLLMLAVSGRGAGGAEVRPGLAGRTATKQEPGAAEAGKTGTATRGPHEASFVGCPATGQLVAVE